MIVLLILLLLQLFSPPETEGIEPFISHRYGSVEGSELPHAYEVRVDDPYSLDHNYVISSADGAEGCIYTEKLPFYSRYVYVNTLLAPQIYGTLRFFQVAEFYQWGAVMDVFDADGEILGQIEGSASLDNWAWFSIRDHHGSRRAEARMDQEGTRILLFPRDNTESPIARLLKKTDDSGDAYWEVSIQDSRTLDDRVLLLFAGFIMDHQQFFVAEGE